MRSPSDPKHSTVFTSLIPYLVTAAAWCLLAAFAVSVRVPSRLWLPVFDWAYPQAVILDRILPALSKWETRAVWLTLYEIAGFLGWLAVERRSWRRGTPWSRAIITWLVIQAAYVAIVSVLIARGIVSE